jgi:S1-C subfamily serine protease
MATLPPGFLDCVVAIGFPVSSEETRWSATGFLFGKFMEAIGESQSRYRSFIVTNRHVLRDESTVVFRFNPEGSEPAREYRTPIIDEQGEPLWVGHRDEEIDLALLPFAGNRLAEQGIKLQVFTDHRDALYREQANDAGLAEGDAVFVLGFPMGLVGGSRSFVIVRQGVIARVRDWLAGTSKEILVDASIFPGNSGGPVVLRPEVVAIGETNPIKTAHLLGVVSGFLPWTDVPSARRPAGRESASRKIPA